MRLPRIVWLPWLAALVVTGCDPKLTGTDDGNDDDNDDPDLVVTAEAQAVGNVLALHAEILRAGLSVAPDFDTASPAASLVRGIMPAGCWELTEQVSPHRWNLRLNGCTDGHGTDYSGGGQFEAVSGLDGFSFFPWYDVDLIRANNPEDDNYNHDVHSGSLSVEFTRSSGTVIAAEVGNFLRHNVRSEIVTFTYEATYTGAVDAFNERPDSGSTARVVWDSVGIFDVTFSGGAATYPMQGITYSVDLATGNVTAVSAL